MLEFAQPACLLLLLLSPGFAWWRWRRRRATVTYSDIELFTNPPRGRSRWAQWGGLGIRALALSLLFVALAGPRWPDLRTRLPAEGIAIMMVVDVSGSMAEPDYFWQGEPISRLEAAKRVFRLFVAGGAAPDGQVFEGRPNDLIGLVVFATQPQAVCPLTLSHSALLQLLDAEQPRSLPTESQTNIGDAIAWALHRLESARGMRKVLVLLTDGEHNVLPPALKPRQAAQLAASLHVPIFAIDAAGEGCSKEAPLEGQQSAASRENSLKGLQELARLTGGRFFQAQDTRRLVEVGLQIDQLQRGEIVSFQYRRYYEGYPYIGLAALASFLLVLLLEATIWRRLP